MFELVVAMCLAGAEAPNCPEWRPYEPYASQTECETEARRIEATLTAKGVKGPTVDCKQIVEPAVGQGYHSLSQPQQVSFRF